jgi:hypothetical protein
MIGTARLNGLDPVFYLCTVLTTIAEHPINRIQELLGSEMSRTTRWQASRLHLSCVFHRYFLRTVNFSPVFLNI